MKRRYLPYFFTLPSMIFLIALGTYPFLSCLYSGFFSFNLGEEPKFVGVDNYINLLFTDPIFWKAVENTIIYAGVGVISETILGLGIALLLNRELRGKSIFLSIFLTPLIMTPVVAGLVWRMFLDPYYGTANYILRMLGWSNPPMWFSRAPTALPGVIIIDIWRNTPFMILTLLAALSSLPISPYEAAQIDGASSLEVFRHITLPLLKPILIVILFFRTMGSLVTFDIIYVATRGGPGTATTTYNYMIFMDVFEFFHVGYPSALATLFWIVILVSVSIFMKYAGEVIWAE